MSPLWKVRWILFEVSSECKCSDSAFVLAMGRNVGVPKLSVARGCGIWYVSTYSNSQLTESVLDVGRF